jgi:hypothetical protein
MNANFQKLAQEAERARAAKVSKFLELLVDPDLSHIVSVLKNGGDPGEPRRFAPSPVRAVPLGFKTGNGIQEKIKSLELGQRFTSEDVYSTLINQDFVFSAKDPRGAVRDALHKLTHGKTPAFRMVKKGKGGQSTVYERIPPQTV